MIEREQQQALNELGARQSSKAFTSPVSALPIRSNPESDPALASGPIPGQSRQCISRGKRPHSKKQGLEV